MSCQLASWVTLVNTSTGHDVHCQTFQHSSISLQCHRSFGQYLADMGSLVLTLEDSFSGVLGEAAVRVAGLGEACPVAGEVTFVQVGLLACIHACMQLEMLAVCLQLVDRVC